MELRQGPEEVSLQFRRESDPERIRELVAGDARMWHAAIDDGVAAGPEAYRPHSDPRVWYVVASDDGSDIALFTLLPQNAVCYEIHVTRAFGRGAARAHRGIFRWAFEHTPARRIVASIPADNPIAIRAARRAGMKPFGVNPASYARGGKLHDQTLLGVSACHQ
jgi:RimJ/RimL family protein N-acetyltransferase